MTSPLLDQILQSPVLPELIQEAVRALGEEQCLREKFYAEITPEHKWEFIQGEVIRHSPTPARHALAILRLFDLLRGHTRGRNFGSVWVDETMTVFPRNDYAPDLCFFGFAKSALISPDTLKFPVPDFVAEVLSPSTEHRDRGVKFEDYALHGVQEYWIIDPVAETVEPFRLQGQVYPPTPRRKDGTISSDVIPGFEIPVRAIFDEEENLATLQRLALEL